jgi:hypothetical protein
MIQMHRDSRAARRWTFMVLVLLPIVAMAVIATAAQIAAAIRNSASANQWLRDNADAVASLAVNVESGGNTTAFNGSCCYGVLQMNTTNIRQYANMTPAQYQQLDLQGQIDAWAQLTVAALQAQAPRTLTGMSTFDGVTVDGNLVLACVQMGAGNCQKMLDSGSCGGFADSNGTTICSMAARARGDSGAVTDMGTGGGGAGSGGSSPIGGYVAPDNCIRSPSGACVSITEALAQGFLQGSGVTMPRLKAGVQAIVVAAVLILMLGAFLGLWNLYARGAMTKAEYLLYTKKGGLAVVLVFMALALL